MMQDEENSQDPSEVESSAPKETEEDTNISVQNPEPVSEEAMAEDKTAKLAQELLYLRAEFENYKKRMEREQDKAIRFSNEKIIGELLFVSDLFERALSHGSALKDSSSELKTYTEGVEMTYRELSQILARFGVEFIGAEGETFNPAWHEAISQQGTSEEKENTILAVVQKGCRLHGRLLKPAKVVVGKADPNFEEKE